MDERIKKLRKKLNLTQQEFADKISVKRGAVANYEIGRNIPSDSVVSLICREFNVDEIWLRTGQGEMFKSRPDTALDTLAKEYDLDYESRVSIEKFLNLSPELRKGMIAYFKEVTAAINTSQLNSAIYNAAAEAAYGKNYGNALPKGSTVSNTTGAIESPENQVNKENIG